MHSTSNMLRTICFTCLFVGGCILPSFTFGWPAAENGDAALCLEKVLHLGRAGRLNEAMKRLEGRCGLGPYVMHMLRGAIYYSQGKWSLSVHEFDCALGVRPKSYSALLYRGDSLLSLGRVNEAVDSYSKSIAIKTGYYAAYLARGFALGELGQDELGMVDINVGFSLLYRSFGTLDVDISVWAELEREFGSQ